MAIRTKKFRNNGTHSEVRAIQITEKNLTDLVAYICRNGGAATGHTGRSYNITPKGKAVYRPARIRIKQFTYGHSWSKQDWRVALIGDWIVRYDNDMFERVKNDDFDRRWTAV